MDSEDGERFIKQLAGFVRTHEKALANALQFQRRESRHRSSQSAGSATTSKSPTLPDRPSTSSSALAATFSLGALNLTSNNMKSARLALTPHHLFYLLSRFEELGISVGPMKVRLENLHDTSSSGNYVSFLSNTQRSRSRDSDVGSIRSVSSVRSVMSGMSALWTSLGIGASISAARTERQKAAVQADLKYLYSAFTKIPCLRLAPDWRARLIRGYEEFPFDSAVPLYVFKNLQALEVSGIDFRQFFGWDRVADQLRSLTLRRAGIEDPADILIDIVLDDMDKRRRRTSKQQPSPTSTVGYSSGGRRGSIVPELQRSMTAPAPVSEPRSSLAELQVGSLTPSEHAVEANESDEASKSPSKHARQRSNSPTLPTSSRGHSSHVRSSHRIARSGSNSSHSSLSDSWYHHHARGSSGNLLTANVLPCSKWRFLRHLSLADNAMTSIPATSLAPLSNTLYSLDVSSNLFSQIPDSLATLTALRALNLSHCMIDSLHSLTRNPLPAITALNLRANRLQSLAGIEKLYPLERLDLRENRLTDPMELARLTGIPDIREIWVEGNPFVRAYKDYRITIFNIFRKTPGYTDDISIDGSGPTYSERRLLIDRALIPDSVPVVKPTAPEVPTIDVNKPTIIHEVFKEGSVVRKERPVPKAIMSEINTTSTRPRKTPKRRIVDLSTNENPPPARFISPRKTPTSPISPLQSPGATSPAEGNYRIFQAPLMEPLSPSALSERRKCSTSSTADVPRVDMSGIKTSNPLPGSLSSEPQPINWKKSLDWDSGAESYRLKIAALRDKVGSDYLSALGEESWEVKHTPSFPSPSTMSDHLAAASMHSGRTLGQPLSS